MKTSRIYVTTSTYCTDKACSVSCQDVQRSSVGYSAGPAYHSARATSGASSIARTVASADAAFSRPHAKVDAEILSRRRRPSPSKRSSNCSRSLQCRRWVESSKGITPEKELEWLRAIRWTNWTAALFIHRWRTRHIGSSDQRCDLASRY